MKKTLLIFGAIALLCFLLIVRLFFKQHSGFVDERGWFAKSVRYEFSAKVDSIWMYNEHSGRLRCLLTQGDPQIDREDSLKLLFKEHDMLYLIYERSGDSITFILPGHASLIAIGDSVRVSSRENNIKFFREGKPVVNDSLSDVLTGFGKPFFLKRK
ncbi:MAG TPA: hypothetical protein VFU05_14810 [Cyclobacteriaceae bacterium]|nr:hypothetical protein [Cyclobacteriaceae bacterium]